MAVPRKKRRVRLLIILGRFLDYPAVLMLSKIWPIYEKLDSIPQSINPTEEAVLQAVDDYYAAYDSADSDSFNSCTCSDLSANDKGAMNDALEAAINNWE